MSAHFFKRTAREHESLIPAGMKQVSEDADLSAPVNVPAFTLPAGEHVNRGMLLPQDTPLPIEVRTVEKNLDRPTAYGTHWLLVGLTVFGALIGVVTWGSLAGSMLPFILRRLGFDPATSSAPFVATLVDVTGLIIYFMVAKVILSGTLL